jgi:hypothetical protein
MTIALLYKTNNQNQNIDYKGKGLYFWNGQFLTWELWKEDYKSRFALYKDFDDSMIHLEECV